MIIRKLITSFLVGIECLDHYTNNHHKLHSHLRNGHLRHLENFQIIDHDLVHIAPLDGDHKMTGRLTGYGKTIDIRYRPTDEHLFSSTRSHEHHENSQHPYDMETSNFKDYDCLYKADNNDANVSGTMAFCDGKLYGALQSDQDYLIDYVNVNDTTVQYMYPLQQNPSSTKSFQDDLPAIYDQSGSSGSIPGDPESAIDFRPRRGISAYDNDGTNNEVNTIELMVFVDSAFMQKYRHLGSRGVDQYVATVVGIMADLYQHPSIGKPLKLKLLDIIKMNSDRFDISTEASKTLRHFCEYQRSFGQYVKKRPDHSILLTGRDICVGQSHYGGSCPTLGYAHIGGMCDSSRSCTVNEDTGLGTAYTATHELGHAFGMLHDGDQNQCVEQSGMIMASSLRATPDYGVFRWSKCARWRLSQFLYSEESKCLREVGDSKVANRPEKIRVRSIVPRSLLPTSVNRLPGQRYSADEQCKMQFGSHSSVCPHNRWKVCAQLFCKIDRNHCRSLLLPAAEGTSCGPDRWCRGGLCIPYGSQGPKPIDGQWGGWTSFSDCLSPCGLGIRIRERKCNAPSPGENGKDCVGERFDVQTCRGPPCEGRQDPRQAQCKDLSNYNERFNHYPEPRSYRSCQLKCLGKKYFGLNSYKYEMQSTIVDNGVSCEYNGQKYCINGECRLIGCDGKLGGARLDRCGVCRGDGSSCKEKEHVWNDHKSYYGKVSIKTIPIGSTNIKVEQLTSSSAFVVLQYERNSTNLMSNVKRNQAGTFYMAGAEWYYERSLSNKDRLYTAGPIHRPINVLADINGRNPGFRIIYHSSKETENESDIYEWVKVPEQCSVSCGGGVQQVNYKCYSVNQNKEVSDQLCPSHLRSSNFHQSCSNHNCESRWNAADWSECSVTCGGGIRKRDITCMQMKVIGDVAVSTQSCLKENPIRPAATETCNMNNCPPNWTYGRRWSKCSARCGEGIRTRNQLCLLKTSGGQSKQVDPVLCTSDRLPERTRPCRGHHCRGSRRNRRRHLPEWSVGDWSECSETCGQGLRRRRVHCEHHRCSRRRPHSTEKCNVKSCESVCEDSTPKCSLYVKANNLCKYFSFETICCASCSASSSS